MRREIEDNVFVFVGHAEFLPGLLFRLVTPAGEETEYLCDSFWEAEIMSRHFGASLVMDLPSEAIPRSHVDEYAINEWAIKPRRAAG